MGQRNSRFQVAFANGFISSINPSYYSRICCFHFSRRSHKYDTLRLLRFLARDSRSVSMKYVNASFFVKSRFSVENSQVFKEPRCINCWGTCTPTTDNSIRDNCPRYNKFEKCALFIEKPCVNLGLIENLIYVGGLWLRRFLWSHFVLMSPFFVNAHFVPCGESDDSYASSLFNVIRNEIQESNVDLFRP